MYLCKCLHLRLSLTCTCAFEIWFSCAQLLLPKKSGNTVQDSGLVQQSHQALHICFLDDYKSVWECYFRFSSQKDTDKDTNIKMWQSKKNKWWCLGLGYVITQADITIAVGLIVQHYFIVKGCLQQMPTVTFTQVKYADIHESYYPVTLI